MTYTKQTVQASGESQGLLGGEVIGVVASNQTPTREGTDEGSR